MKIIKMKKLIEKVKEAKTVNDIDEAIAGSLTEAVGDDAPYLHYNKWGNDEDYGYAGGWNYLNRLASQKVINPNNLTMESLSKFGFSNLEIQDFINRGLLELNAEGKMILKLRN